MSTTQTVFPLVSVRNPWGFLIQNGFKKIENRKKQLGTNFHNTWIALQVSKTFKSTEEKYTQKYLQNHPSLLEKSSKISKYFANPSFKPTNHFQIAQIINSKIKPQMGCIIAFIKISKCVDSAVGSKIDPLYCDTPFKANSHWHISDVIPLLSKEYITARGGMGCARISDRKLNQTLSNVLNVKLQKRQTETVPKIEKKSEQKETEIQNPKIKTESDDDDILDIMNDLETAMTQTQQSSEKENDAINIVSEINFTSPKNKKRKRKEIVQSDDDSVYDISQPTKKTKIISNSDSNSNGFRKFSRMNSLLDMKKSKIDLMIPANANGNIGDSDEDTDAELEAMLAEKRRTKNAENGNKLSKIQRKILSNPNEIRRKEHLALPDRYKHRIIVFDTETACFKPEGVIIEIGAVELINGKVTGRKFQSYIKPWAKIHPKAMAVHGITERFLESYADGDIYEIVQSFMEWIYSDCLCMQCQKLEGDSNRKHKLKLVGHNVVFDLRQLNGAIEYCQAKMTHKIWKRVESDIAFDTQVYYRNVLGNVASYSLDAMCLKFGVKSDARKHSHGALVDAMVTAKCLQEMWKREKDVQDRKCKNRFFTKKL